MLVDLSERNGGLMIDLGSENGEWVEQVGDAGEGQLANAEGLDTTNGFR